MTAMTGRKISVEIDGEVVSAQVLRAVVTSAAREADQVTFAEASGTGSRDYSLEITYLQDPAAGTVWDLIFTAAGTDVPVILHTGDTVGAATPDFEMEATVTEGDTLVGGDASTTSTRYVATAIWPLTAKPTRVTS